MPILKDLELYLGGEKIGKAYLGNNPIYGFSSLLLDDNPGAAIALSLRKLNSNYSGSCIRVRRSSDNVEQDIGFVDGVVNIAALQSFVGGFDGYVTTWYDQSGNSNNAIQSIATKQAKIVISGSVNTINNKPCLYFDGNNYSGYITDYNLGSIYSMFLISKSIHTNYHRVITSRDRNRLLTTRMIGYSFLPSNNGWIVDYTESYVNLALANMTISNTESRGYMNSIDITEVTNRINEDWGLVSLGSEHTISNQYFTGYLSEVIIYPTAQINNRIPLESNIINYYNII